MATKQKAKKKKRSLATKKKAAAKKKLSKKKAPLKKKTTRRNSTKLLKKRVRGKSQIVDTVNYSPAGLGSRSGGQSGDLQGLSNREGANSESVDELLEEGNAFEAEAVKGVEDAGDADKGEVHTHEVPEDDVPGEYLDKD